MLKDIFCKDIEMLYRTPIVQQTAFWSVVKQKLGFTSLAVNFKLRGEELAKSNSNSEYILSDLLVIIQQIDNLHSIAYVPYGPEIEPKDDSKGVFLEELSECIRPYLPDNCIMIRYDLCWESFWAKDADFYDNEGLWTGPPEKSIQELRLNFSTANWNLKKSYSNNLPSSTIYLKLQNEPADLLVQMKPKTRYNIGLSARKGVVVKSMSINELDVWYNMYRQTALRNKIYLHNIEYFKAVLSAKVENALSPAEVMLLVAEAEGMPLAAMFLVISGNRGSYLYGASTSENRNYMATYALQWKAMNIAREKGCTEYDMFGVSPRPDPSHPLYGLYRFKTGFGGEIYHALGCWDYPLDIKTYNSFSIHELRSRGYHC